MGRRVAASVWILIGLTVLVALVGALILTVRWMTKWSD
jgi:hypothetical protein